MPSHKTPFPSNPIQGGADIIRSSVKQDDKQDREKGGATGEAVGTLEKQTAAGAALVTDAARGAVRRQVERRMKEGSRKKADTADKRDSAPDKPPDPHGGEAAADVGRGEAGGRDIPRRPTHTAPGDITKHLEESPPYWAGRGKKKVVQERCRGKAGEVKADGLEAELRQSPKSAAKAKIRAQAIQARHKAPPNIFQYVRQEGEMQEPSKISAKTKLKKEAAQARRKGGISSQPAAPSQAGPVEQPPSFFSALAPERRRDGLQAKARRRVQNAGKAAEAAIPRPVQRPFNAAISGRPSAATLKQQKKRAAKKAVKQAQKAKTAIKATGDTAKVSVKIVQAVARAVAATVGAIIGLLGGGVLVVVLLIVAAAAALLNSPFGILFSNENTGPGTIPISMAVGQLNMEFSNHLDALQGDEYDAVYIHGEVADWVEVLAVFAAKTALADGDAAADVVTIDEGRIERLRTVFWDMNPVRTTVDHIHYSGSGEDDPGWTEVILHIYIESKTAEEMKTVYVFDRQAAEVLDELLIERALLEELIHTVVISDQDAQEVLKRLPADLSPERRAAVAKALELVGKVSYFWGGKSYVIDWDDRWGTLMQVTSPGSSSTGKWIPFGLDCTGYLDWTFRNAGLPSAGHWYIGTNCTETTWEQAEPGDIAFWPDNSHVGLVVGRDESGRALVVHCSYSLNTVAISDYAFGFTKVGKPELYGE